MASALEHYEHHLGPVYTWMVGDLQIVIERSREELRGLGLGPDGHGVAVDLGTGPGGYAIPLAEWGYDTLALDTCTPLVAELRGRVGTLPLRVVQADLLSFRRHCGGRAQVILCMGDTLTHLPTQEDVRRLLDDVGATLAAPGLFCATFRDYYTAQLQGAARFIPVRSDESRILTCFLEYAADRVTVYDILQERAEAGWRQSVSNYPKLRLDPAWIITLLEAHGLTVQQDKTSSGMVRLAARRGPQL